MHQVETQGAEDYELIESRAFELENLNADLKKERSDLASDLAKYKAELKQSKERSKVTFGSFIGHNGSFEWFNIIRNCVVYVMRFLQVHKTA